MTSLDTALGDIFHYWPHFLPDGRHYLYFVRTAKAETTGIRVGTLDAPLPRADRLLISTISNAAYAGPGQPGWLGKGAGHLMFLSDRAPAAPKHSTRRNLRSKAIRSKSPRMWGMHGRPAEVIFQSRPTGHLPTDPQAV